MMIKKPVPRLPSVSIKEIAARRDAAHVELLDYIATDLCCYRTAQPPELVMQQIKHWDPVLDNIAQRYGHRPATTTGLAALSAHPDLKDAIARDVAALPDDLFGVLYMLTTQLGSIYLGLAVVQKTIDIDTALAAHFCDEEYYDAIARGTDYEPDPMLMARRAAMAQELGAALACL